MTTIRMDDAERAHSERCADTIKRYWARKGKSVRVWIEEAQFWGLDRIYAVRSEMKEGRP